MNEEELKPLDIPAFPLRNYKHWILDAHNDHIFGAELNISENDASEIVRLLNQCWKEIDRLKAELSDYGKRAIENDAVMRKRCYEAEAALQAKDAEIAELKKKYDEDMTGWAIESDQWERKEAVILEILERSMGLWAAVHANIKDGARIELDLICSVMNRIEQVLKRTSHRKPEEAGK